MESNKKSNNLLPWFLAFISLLTALGGPVIFPRLVAKYYAKVNPTKFPIDSSLVIQLHNSIEKINKLTKEVQDKNNQINKLTKEIVDKNNQINKSEGGKVPYCSKIQGTFERVDQVYGLLKMKITQTGCNIKGDYSTPDIKHTFTGEWNQNNKSFTVTVRRGNDGSCMTQMYGSLSKEDNAVKLVIKSTAGLCGVPVNYSETSIFNRIRE